MVDSRNQESWKCLMFCHYIHLCWFEEITFEECKASELFFDCIRKYALKQEAACVFHHHMNDSIGLILFCIQLNVICFIKNKITRIPLVSFLIVVMSLHKLCNQFTWLIDKGFSIKWVRHSTTIIQTHLNIVDKGKVGFPSFVLLLIKVMN